MGSTILKFDQDSITVRVKYFYREGYVRSVLKTPLEPYYWHDIKDLLLKINLDELKEEYSSTEPIDDGIEFEFTFNVNNKTKATRIHYGRNDQILKLVELLNDRLPPEFQIAYNERTSKPHQD